MKELYVSKVLDPDTCNVSGYIVKMKGPKDLYGTKIPDCPVFRSEKLALRFLEDMKKKFA